MKTVEEANKHQWNNQKAKQKLTELLVPKPQTCENTFYKLRKVAKKNREVFSELKCQKASDIMSFTSQKYQNHNWA